MNAEFNLKNFAHWIFALAWSLCAAANAMHAAICRIEEKTGLCVLCLFGCAFSIVNAMTEFSDIKDRPEKETKA